jgi:hypothetical protein
MNLVDLKKYDHLKLIPKSLMSSNDFITKVLWTIIKELGKVHFSEINKEFERATGNLISDYFEFKDDEMKQFLKLKKNVFFLDDKGYAKARDDFDENAQLNPSNADGLNKRKGSGAVGKGGANGSHGGSSGGVIVID